MLIYIRFTRLFYFSLLILVYNNIKTSDSKIIQSYAKDNSSVNLRASSKSIYQFINEKNSAIREIFTTKDESITKQNLKIKSNNKNSNFRNTQEKGVCYATCTERMAINLRITPVKYNVESETFVKQCSISHKVFKQKGIKMFVAKVCFDNMLVIKEKSSVIASIEGGTKTTRMKGIRKKPKVLKVRVDCDGGCCKDCEDEKMQKVLATPSDTEGITLINDCAVGDDVPKKITTEKDGETIEKYTFHVCRADRHILKYNEHISKLKRQRKPVNTEPNNIPAQGCEVNTCCKTCIVKDTISTKKETEPESDNNNNSENTQIVNVIVTANEQGNDFVQNCATTNNEDPVTDKFSNTVYPIAICIEDFNVIKDNPNVVSLEKFSPGSEMEDNKKEKNNDGNNMEGTNESINNGEIINDDNNTKGINETIKSGENFYDDTSLGGKNKTFKNNKGENLEGNNMEGNNIEGTNDIKNNDENLEGNIMEGNNMEGNNMEGTNDPKNNEENLEGNNMEGTNEFKNNEEFMNGNEMKGTTEPMKAEDNYYNDNYIKEINESADEGPPMGEEKWISNPYGRL